MPKTKFNMILNYYSFHDPLVRSLKPTPKKLDKAISIHKPSDSNNAVVVL